MNVVQIRKLQLMIRSEICIYHIHPYSLLRGEGFSLALLVAALSHQLPAGGPLSPKKHS